MILDTFLKFPGIAYNAWKKYMFISMHGSLKLLAGSKSVGSTKIQWSNLIKNGLIRYQ